jgi:hypothetical protein
MPTEHRKRPGEDAIAKVLDWAGLLFGLSVLVLLANLTVSAT